MHYRILGAPLSPFVRKVRVLCAKKAIAYDLEPINPFAPPDDFGVVSPLKKIPVLAIEDGHTQYLPDSSAICAYFEQLQPEPPLLPQAPLARGLALWFEEYGDSALVGAIGPGIFQPVVLARLMGRSPDRARADQTVHDQLPALFDYLQSQLGDREFLVDDAFTLADIGVVSPLVNLHHAGYRVDGERWPRLAAYVGRILDRPSFAEAVAGEEKMLQG